MKKLIILFLLFFTGSLGLQAQIFTVTSTNDNPSSPGSGELRKAVNDALFYLSPGQHPGSTVFIEFDAPGLVALKDNIPITNTTGSIYFKPATGVTTQQGVTIDATNPFVSGELITITPTSLNGVINFKDLFFQNIYKSGVAKTTLYFKSLETSFFIDNCTFTNCSGEINCEFSKAITVTNSHFTKNMSFATIDNPSVKNKDVVNIVFDKNTYNYSVSITTVDALLIHYTSNSRDTYAEINENNFTSISPNNELEVINDKNSGNATTTFYCKKNNFSNANIAIALKDPFLSYTIDENNFTNINKALQLYFFNNQGSNGNNIYGLDLIRSGNPFGVMEKNGKNNFNNSNINIYDYLCSSTNVANRDYILGYDNIGQIYATNDLGISSPTIVRAVKTHAYMNNINGCNLHLPTTTINSGTSLQNHNLNFSFTLTPPSGVSMVANNQWVADFYKSNTSGHILDYLGAYPFTITNTSGSSTFTGSIAIPDNIIACGERIAVMATSLGGTGGGIITAGTFDPAYFTLPARTCPSSVSINVPGSACIDEAADFTSTIGSGSVCLEPQAYSFVWDFGDGQTSSDATPQHIYNDPGTYNVSVVATSPSCTVTLSPPGYQQVTVTNNCCPSCLPSFKPIAGKKYVISAWVSEQNVNKSSFSAPQIIVKSAIDENSTASVVGTYAAKGQVIDGWQRIDEVFTVPLNHNWFDVELVNANTTGGADVYFDDIRIHPFDASFKSFVYDPVSLRFVAELDNNNYATSYEYDDEGKLVRVKKETEKKITTIKETRTASPKKSN